MPPSSSSTPANATPSSSRLQLAAHSARAQSSAACTAGSDRHTRALVKAGQNVTTVGGRSLDRQVILEEDDYADSLSRIIKRDFFPELARLDATNEYLAAVEAMDEQRLEASVRKLWDIEGETGDTPRFPGGRHGSSSTPVPFASTPSSHRPSRVIPSSASTIARASHLPSLDKFQRSHTSEDNASFTAVLADENALRKRRLAWAFDEEAKVRARVKDGEERWRRRLEGVPRTEQEHARLVEDVKERERLRIAGPSKGKAREILPAAPAPTTTTDGSISTALTTTTASSAAGKALSPPLPPTDLPLPPSAPLAVALRAAGLPETRTDDAAVAERDERERVRAVREEAEKGKASVDAWPWKARNSLMFAPDVDVSPHALPLTSRASDAALAGPPREIRHEATRLPDGFAFMVGERAGASASGSSGGGTSPTRSEVGAAIAGTPYHRPSASSATPAHPTIGRYPLVAPLPSPTPSLLGPARISQLLTWGTLLSTPRALPGAATGAGSSVGGWTIKDPSKRDALGRELAGKAGKALADRAKASSSKRRKVSDGLMGPPASTTASLAAGRRSLVGMSPAARGLSERLKASSSSTAGSLTPRLAGGGGSTGSAGKRRGEAMERVAGWAASAAAPDLGRRRWSESPSPRVTRARE